MIRADFIFNFQSRFFYTRHAVILQQESVKIKNAKQKNKSTGPEDGGGLFSPTLEYSSGYYVR